MTLAHPTTLATKTMDITKHFSFEGKALTTQTDENGLDWFSANKDTLRDLYTILLDHAQLQHVPINIRAKLLDTVFSTLPEVGRLRNTRHGELVEVWAFKEAWEKAGYPLTFYSFLIYTNVRRLLGHPELSFNVFDFFTTSLLLREKHAKKEFCIYEVVARDLGGTVCGGSNRADVYVGDVPVEIKNEGYTQAFLKQIQRYVRASGQTLGILVTTGANPAPMTDEILHITYKFNRLTETWEGNEDELLTVKQRLSAS